ncbi:UvrD-helicase domain-containing protein [Actinosynnema sp. NPDC023658]|uniref:UvrD-helicase domain-containing protein n=1 Tax=Actinosynnema sp. NPDC023658 TaxID=3155465 RepID=UPI0033E3804B
MTTIEARRKQALLRQKDAIERPAPLYVQACPGAGKTKVIVERHLSGGSMRGRCGRAVVSFTNVACDEVVRRCREARRDDLLAFPNFIGTIDTFLWRYLVRPFLPGGKVWERLDSWDRINAKVDIPGGPKYRPRLSDFQFSRDESATACTARLQPSKNFALYRALNSKGLLDAAEKAALKTRKRHIDFGYITGHEIRILALHAMNKPDVHPIATLSTRFTEVVIDEAQDCSHLDLAILAKLRDAGLPLVFVCDPDQAIYEFRGARPDKVREFGITLGSRVDLTGNWRSSSAICNLAATLRPTRFARPPDDPIGRHHDEPAGIVLVKTGNGTLDHALAVFTDRADAMGIPTDNRLVLAHSAANLPRQAGPTGNPPDAAAARVAWAATILSAPHQSRRRRDSAYDVLERCLLDYWYAHTDGKSTKNLCDRLGIDNQTLRSTAARFAAALPDLDHGTFGNWCTAVNKLLKHHPPQPDIVRQNNSGSLRASPALKLATAREAGGASSKRKSEPVRTSLIHQVKGAEADAVLVIVPPKDKRTEAVIDAWISGVHEDHVAESLRVLYVAATRARRLLAIALPESAHDRIAAHLKDNNVPVDLDIT